MVRSSTQRGEEAVSVISTLTPSKKTQQYWHQTTGMLLQHPADDASVAWLHWNAQSDGERYECFLKNFADKLDAVIELMEEHDGVLSDGLTDGLADLGIDFAEPVLKTGGHKFLTDSVESRKEKGRKLPR
jgi:hypothetical protein